MRRRPFAAALLLPVLAAPAAAREGLDTRHVRLEARLDPARRSIEARATLALRLLRPAETIDLDAIGLDVRRVLAGGQELGFESVPGALRVRLPRPAAAGAELELRIDYEAAPRRGLYFVSPGRSRRPIAAQAWTSFWPRDARHVLPCNDDLTDKTTSELLVSVPESWRVMGTGSLVGSVSEPGRRTWHYRMDRPHALYVLAFVAGEYEEVVGGGEVPLHYLVYPGRAEDARHTFARTPEMMTFFAERAGQPFPWPKYALSVAADFVHGAMENVSAVTLADRLLLDAGARADGSSDDTLAHELAHQWWGNLVTPARWNDAWLSEGLATFFADAWQEHADGADAGRWKRLEHLDVWSALAEDARRRPVVPEGDVEPWLVLDANVYGRAALIVAHLRQLLGEEPFWAGLRSFLRRFAEGNATTEDFERALSAAAGRNLAWFFDQWLRRPQASPIQAAWRFDPEGARVVLGLRQAEPPLVAAIDVVLLGPSGARRERIFVERAIQEFSLPAAGPPASVIFDPDALLPLSVEVATPAAGRRAELAYGPGAACRARAARALGRVAGPEAVAALATALRDDAFWGVRAAAGAALGPQTSPEAREALRGGLRDADPRVRAACAEALAAEGASAGEALLSLTARDDSGLVGAAALRALGRSRAPGAWEALAAALGQDSHGERLRLAALDGLAALGDRQGLALALEHVGVGRDVRVRLAAIATLGALGQGQGVAVSRLTKLLADGDARVKAAAARALSGPVAADTLHALRAAAAGEDHPAFRRDLEAALRRLEGRER